MLSLKLMTVYSSPWSLQLKSTPAVTIAVTRVVVGQVLLDQLLH